jgi:AAA domain
MNLHYAPFTDPRHNDGYAFEFPSLTCPQEPRRKLGRLSAADLLMKELPPVRYVVPSYLAEGLTILAGWPMLGKSWLSLDLAIAVASGGLALSSGSGRGG